MEQDVIEIPEDWLGGGNYFPLCDLDKNIWIIEKRDSVPDGHRAVCMAHGRVINAWVCKERVIDVETHELFPRENVTVLGVPVKVIVNAFNCGKVIRLHKK